MSLEEDPYDPVDFQVSSGHAGDKTGQSHDSVDTPEPAGAGKIVQSSFYHHIARTQRMSEGFQRHAGITDVLPVIGAQQRQGAGADRFHHLFSYPKASQQPSSWFSPRHLRGGGRGEA